MIIGILILAYLAFGLICFIAFASEKKLFLYASILLGLTALTVHGGFIIGRGLEAGRLPLTNTYETLIFLSFLIVVIYFFIFLKYRSTAAGGFAGIVASLLLALTSLLSPEIEPLLPSLKSNWLLFHVVSAFIGYSSFAVAFGSAVSLLLFDIWVKPLLKKPPARRKMELAVDYLDGLTYRLISAGFPFLTLGIATGAVWANASWGRYWNWDPKETCAFVTWLVYAVCLHMRQADDFRGRPAALFAATGFAAVMFTYFGVNFWLSSLHAYA